MNHQKFIPIVALALCFFSAGDGCAAVPLTIPDSGCGYQKTAEASELCMKKGEKTIREMTAGQQLRQPILERQWQDRLSLEQLDIVPQESGAAAAVQNAQVQAPLVQRFSENIWEKIGNSLLVQGQNLGPTRLERIGSASAGTDLYTDTHLYVFVSESVPVSTLRNYLSALAHVNVAYVLRGPVGDDPSRFAPTQIWAQRVLCKLREGEALQKAEDCERDPLDINPNLFRILNIQHVPALVYVPQPAQLGACGTAEETNAESQIDALIWYGDVAPEYVLRRFIEARPDDTTLREMASRVTSEHGTSGGAR